MVTIKFLKRLFIAAHLLLLLSLPLFALALSVSQADQATQTKNNSPVILILGDSLSAAYRISQKSAWPTLLQQRLIEKQYPHKVINASISGETTSGGVSRTEHALSIHLPDIVVLELGANDGLRGLPIKQIKHNLSTIISKSNKSGAKVLLVGMQIASNYGIHYTQSFRDNYQSLAKEHQLALVPFLLEGVSENKELMQEDNLHPRATAQPIILDNIWPHLEPLVRETLGLETRVLKRDARKPTAGHSRTAI